MFKIHDDKVYFVAETPIHMEKKGVRVLKVRNIEDTNKASPDDDDSFSHADVEIDGQSYPLNFVSDIMDENDVNNALDEFYRIQQTGEYWEAHDGKSLTDAIHEFRWAILKDAIQKRGHEAVADFVGTDISSDTYDRVMDETEAQMPDEEFERFWEKYI